MLIAEMDKLRKQNVELETANSKNMRALQDLQIQFDQLDYERNNLSKSYVEERDKRIKLEVGNQAKEVQTPRSQSVAVSSFSCILVFLLLNHKCCFQKTRVYRRARKQLLISEIIYIFD